MVQALLPSSLTQAHAPHALVWHPMHPLLSMQSRVRRVGQHFVDFAYTMQVG